MDRASTMVRRAVATLRLAVSHIDERAAVPPHDCNCLRAAGMIWTDDLAIGSGMSVQLAVAHPRGAQVIHHVFRPDNSPQRLATGDVLPPTSAAATALALPHDGRCVFAAKPDADAAELATVVPCPKAPEHAAALSVTGPADLLHPALSASVRYRHLLCHAAASIRVSLTAGKPTRA
ncbi:IclR family transcriptional regulator [Streptomyces sp. WZ-12]|uniref:IclR family transcriptional regulator n=1 Tax=Streptomyces sp. WZ-12 TaxID=3030210 RepID=UPI0023814D1D|nr:IclR family transcriptional regulator [Streptomyces sp. WZ-12]